MSELEEVIAKIRRGVESGVLCAYERHDDVLKFRQTHPKLYNMVIRRDCDTSMLKKMLNVYSQVQSGRFTQEAGDVAFGQVAADRYVNPLVQDTERPAKKHKNK